MENNLKWMQHFSTMLEMQKKMLIEGTDLDVRLAFSNGEYLFAHKAILTSYSDFFKECLKTVPETVETVIVIPDIKINIMKDILDFIYLGEVTITSHNLTEFLECNTFLGIKNSISFECALHTNFVNKVEKSEFSSPNPIALAIPVLANTTKNDDTMEIEELEKQTDEEYEDTETEGAELEVTQEEEEMNVTHSFVESLEEETDQPSQTDEQEEHSYILTESGEKSYIIKEQTIQEGQIKIEVSTVPNSSNEDGNSQTTIEVIEEKPNTTSTIPVEYVIEKKSTKPQAQYSAHKVYTEREHSINLAIKDVLNECISLSKASSKYNISKTVLWRRIRNEPQYKHNRNNPLLSLAGDRLGRGDTLKSISQSLNIPMSTLHRHKVRLLEQGYLPNTVSQVKRRLEEDKVNLKIKLENAIKACQMGMSQNKAAQDFGISKSTLWRHFKKVESQSIKQEVPNDQKSNDPLEFGTIEYTIEGDHEIVEEEREYSISEFDDDDNKFV